MSNGKCCAEQVVVNEINPAEERLPYKTDANWQDLVKSTLRPDEFKDEYPTTSGLRRVCELLYGKIVLAGGELKHFADKSSVVSYTIHCIEYATSNKVIQIGLADCTEANASSPFINHPVATAETRAKGRALRDMMCLNFVTYEEAGIEGSRELAKDVQIRAIRKSADKLNLDLNKFMTKYCGLSEKQLDPKMGKDVADKLLEQLNEFNNNKEIPQEILA